MGSGSDNGEDNVPEIVLTRRRNIARNEAVLASLGIDSKTSAPNRRPQCPSTEKTKIKKRRRQAPTEPTRRSSRVKGEHGPDEHICLPDNFKEPSAGRHLQDNRPPLVPIGEEEALAKLQALEETHDAKVAARTEAGEDGRADHLKGTASYAHCLHRVLTMSDTALAGRVRSIERARGAKAKEKMLVFARVLRAEGKMGLLAMAEAALRRLVQGLPLPPKDEDR